jgi:hypothetical protein
MSKPRKYIEIKLKIDNKEDRDNLILALSRNGYAPIEFIEEKSSYNNWEKKYYVIFKY